MTIGSTLADQSAIPQEIAYVLGQILNRDNVQPEDDFFSLGGDSLAANELTFAIEERYGVTLDPVEIFENPRIADFANIVVWLKEHPEPDSMQFAELRSG